MELREDVGREASPTAAVVDGQSLNSAEKASNRLAANPYAGDVGGTAPKAPHSDHLQMTHPTQYLRGRALIAFVYKFNIYADG